LLLLFPSSFFDDFIDDPSTILVDFLDNNLSLSNIDASCPMLSLLFLFYLFCSLLIPELILR